MQKIKGHTIIEIVVAMIISMLVISIAYKTFDIIFSQYLQFKKNNERLQEISLLDLLLIKDFSESEYVLKETEGIECYFHDRTIRYNLSEDFIIRLDGSLIDTFNVKPKNLYFGYFNEQVKEMHKLIDRLSFEHRDKEEVNYFVYRKMYAADFLMQAEKFNGIN